MEFCAGGSVADLNLLTKGTLNEEQLQAVIAYSLLGLNQLHLRQSIHRVCIIIFLCFVNNLYTYLFV
jgi:hypothetical protein